MVAQLCSFSRSRDIANFVIFIFFLWMDELHSPSTWLVRSPLTQFVVYFSSLGPFIYSNVKSRYLPLKVGRLGPSNNHANAYALPFKTTLKLVHMHLATRSFARTAYPFVYTSQSLACSVCLALLPRSAALSFVSSFTYSLP